MKEDSGTESGITFGVKEKFPVHKEKKKYQLKHMSNRRTSQT